MRMRMRVWTCVDVCAFVHIHDGSRLGVGYLAYGRVVIAFSLDTGDILDRFVGDSIDPFVSRYDLHFFLLVLEMSLGNACPLALCDPGATGPKPPPLFASGLLL